MKLSVSLSDDDVAVLDAYVRENDLASRSAALQEAVTLLRHRQLENEYEVAIGEWSASGDADAWEVTVGDGIGDDPEAQRWSDTYRADQDRRGPAKVPPAEGDGAAG